MSKYLDFRMCVACRSYANLKSYQGNFEVTMLLNTLYMTVIQPIEKRDILHIKSKTIESWLYDEAVRIEKYENIITSDEMVQFLRNGLAHFNILVDPEGADNDPEKDSISRICIYALDRLPKKCKDCERLVKRKWNHGKLKGNENVICSFEFTVEQLRRFVDLVYKLQSKSFSIRTDIDKDIKKMCAKCPYDLVGAHHANRNNTI